jgi:hypothetical protein
VSLRATPPMAVLLATALGALCTRLSGGAGGPLALQTLADQFGAAKLGCICLCFGGPIAKGLYSVLTIQ